MISDDIYWIPDGVKPIGHVDELLDYVYNQPKKIEFVLDIPQGKYEEDAEKHIEDEILEMLAITEEDLLLESALQTYDHKLYIEELIAEALQESKPIINTINANKPSTEQQQINSTFKTYYEKQYLSFQDSQLNPDDEITFKTPDINTLIQLLQANCDNTEDVEDIIMYIKREQHQKVIHRFTQLKGCARKLVFNYIKLQQKQPEFLQLVLSQIKDLSMIDALSTELLLDNYNEQQLLTVLDKQIPVVRYKILLNVKKDDRLMIEFFELICLLHPEQVIVELKKGGYPQDECLKLCRKYANQKGLAYLLERSGSVVEAINIQFDLFIQALKIKLQRNNQLIEGGESLVRYIEEHLEPALNICRLNSKRHDDESDNNWFLVLIRLTKLRQEFHKIKFTQVLKCFNSVQTNLLEEILERTKIKSLLDNLNQTMKYFEFQELKSTFAQMLSGQQYELAIQGQSTMLVKQTANKQLNLLFEQSCIGTSVESYCCHCQKSITGQCKVFLDCKHSFHVECAPEPLCKLCIQVLTILISKLLVNFVNRRSTRLLVPNTTIVPPQEPVKSSAKQLKLRKLKQFDLR